MATKSKREELIEKALALFYRDGFHATGIDKVLAEAGCAKMTLYKHFKSKDELILAALRRIDEVWRNQHLREIERRAKTPLGRILAMFDLLDGLCKEENFKGCIFINAAAEYSEPDSPIQQFCADHKREGRAYIARLCREAGVPNAEEVARQISFLIEGVLVLGHVLHDYGAAQSAKRAVRTLLESALGKPLPEIA